jgi:hypothetical protein
MQEVASGTEAIVKDLNLTHMGFRWMTLRNFPDKKLLNLGTNDLL